MPFFGLALFWDNPKAAHMQEGKRGRIKGASNRTEGNFVSQVLINDSRVLVSRRLGVFGQLQFLRVVEAQLETIAKPIQNEGN